MNMPVLDILKGFEYDYIASLFKWHILKNGSESCSMLWWSPIALGLCLADVRLHHDNPWLVHTPAREVDDNMITTC